MYITFPVIKCCIRSTWNCDALGKGIERHIMSINIELIHLTSRTLRRYGKI